MKKSLFALAALGAFASAAQAQSSVTLYGTFDASLGYVTGLPTNNQSSATATTTTQVTTGTNFGYLENNHATSSWGLRGSESLGGGLTASFNAESDLLTNNGNTHSSGIFRRAAFVSLTDAKLGGIALGRIPNAFPQATGQMLPLSGNLAHQWRTVIFSSNADQFSNSLRYSSPTLMSTNVVLQYAFSNTVEEMEAGSAFAAHLVNKSIKNLQFTAAYQNLKGQASTATGGGVGFSAAAANASTTNLEGMAVGLKYKFTPAIEVGLLYGQGRINNGGTTGNATSATQDTAVGGGVAYRATPAVILGANYVQSNRGSSMINLQAHYSLSKRTRLYSQLTFATAADERIDTSASGTLGRSFSAASCNSSSITQCMGGLPGTGGSGNVPSNSNGYVFGVIHTF